MDAIEQEDLTFDSAELNKNVFYFCGSILHYYKDVLNEKEFFVCKNLVNGQSIKTVSEPLGLTAERTRQIFQKSIIKIRKAFQGTMDEMMALKEKNEELTHRNFILEKELLSEQSVKRAESVINLETDLCHRAKELLATPLNNLPVTVRARNVLQGARVSFFKEIPLLTIDDLMTVNQCGRKTVLEIQNFLDDFTLQLGLSFDEVVFRLSKLTDKDIPRFSYNRFR